MLAKMSIGMAVYVAKGMVIFSLFSYLVVHCIMCLSHTGTGVFIKFPVSVPQCLKCIIMRLSHTSTGVFIECPYCSSVPKVYY